MTLSRADTDKLLKLQEQCDLCKEAIIHESDVPVREAMQDVCEECQRVRIRVPELMELRRKLEGFNNEEKK